jgi:hypothetical protein
VGENIFNISWRFDSMEKTLYRGNGRIERCFDAELVLKTLDKTIE